MNIDAAFKLFDIRGLYPQVVDEKLAFILGKALTGFLHPKSIVIASDTRESSGPLKNFLINGLSQECKKISDLFEVPTPEFYYAMATGNFDLGVMVTASHISSEENGMKLVKKGGMPFDMSEVAALKDFVKSIPEQPIVVPSFEPVRVNLTDVYLNDMVSKVKTTKFISKVVLEVTESSVVTPVMVLFSRLRINFALSKSSHGGNPLLPENRVELVNTVKNLKADLGIMWDSDGDRVIFVQPDGKMIPMSFVLGILAADEVRKHDGGKIGVDVRTGLVVRDLVEQAGGTIEVFPAWSQFIKFGMKEDPEIIFGGETSGHFVHKDFYTIDDGILTSLKFLAIWENTDVKAQITELSKKYFELPEKNFPVNLDQAPTILEKLAEFYRTQNVMVSVVDGLTVYGQDYRFNIRASLTEPFLRLNLETTGENRSQEIISEIEKHLK